MTRRLITILVIAAFAIGAAYAAQGKAPTQGRRPKAAAAKNLRPDLGLTPQQASQVREIVRQFRHDVRGVLQSNLSDQEKQTKVKELKAKASDAIMALLTQEQKDKAKQTGWIDRILSLRARAGQALRWILGQLNLTEQQKVSIKSIVKESAEKAKAIRDDATLTAEQKRTKLLELRTQTHESILAVLTPEQQQKFKELISKCRQPGPGRSRRSG